MLPANKRIAPSLSPTVYIVLPSALLTCLTVYLINKPWSLKTFYTVTSRKTPITASAIKNASSDLRSKSTFTGCFVDMESAKLLCSMRISINMIGTDKIFLIMVEKKHYMIRSEFTDESPKLPTKFHILKSTNEGEN